MSEGDLEVKKLVRIMWRWRNKWRPCGMKKWMKAVWRWRNEWRPCVKVMWRWKNEWKLYARGKMRDGRMAVKKWGSHTDMEKRGSYESKEISADHMKSVSPEGVLWALTDNTHEMLNADWRGDVMAFCSLERLTHSVCLGDYSKHLRQPPLSSIRSTVSGVRRLDTTEHHPSD